LAGGVAASAGKHLLVSGSNKELLINRSPEINSKKANKRADLASAGGKRTSGGAINALSLERRNYEQQLARDLTNNQQTNVY
jgi:hypothetical protein